MVPPFQQSVRHQSFTHVPKRLFHPSLPKPFLGPLAAGFAVGLAAISLKYLMEVGKGAAAAASSEQAASSATTKSSDSSSSPNDSEDRGLDARGRRGRPAAARPKLEEIIGIDLGMFSTRVALPQVEAGGVLNGIRVIENADGARMTPSVVGVQGNETVMGAAARRQLYTLPSNTVFGLKHLLGRKIDDPIAQRILKLNKVETTDDGKGGIVLSIGGVSMTPQEATAKLIDSVRKSAENFLGKKVRHGSFAIPHDFNEEQREALKQAAKLAGLNPFLLTEEPVAGLYGSEFESTGDLEGGLQGSALLLDLGSSFCASVLKRKEGGDFEISKAQRDGFLTGKQFEDELLMFVVKKFAMEKNIDLLTDPLSEQRIREAIEKAKTELSSTVKTAINLPYITADAKGPKHLNEDITRSKYELLNEVHFGNAQSFLQQFLSGVDKSDLKVVLTGSFCKTPKVQKVVQDVIGKGQLTFGDLEKADERVVIGTVVRAVTALRDS